MIGYGDWNVFTEGFHTHAPQYLESIFSQSNGYLGARAAFVLDGALTHERCTYMAGGFDYLSPGITDLVNLPDPFHCLVKIAGSRPGLDNGRYTGFTQRLDLRDGLYSRDSVWQDAQGRETNLKLSRFISMADKHTAAMCIELTALNYDGEAELLLGLDTDVLNLPVHDDQTLANDQTVRMLKVLDDKSSPGFCSLLAESRTGRLKIDMQCRIIQSHGSQTDGSTENCPARLLTVPLAKGQTVHIDKLISVNNGRPSEQDFDVLLEESRKAWEVRWADADIVVENDEPNLQTALRYNLFQLMQSRPYCDPTISIGARGLTHARYKGCCFWDTDIFLLPFFLYTDPTAARDLVSFRLDTLPDARANAKVLNLDGARYPWMCAVGGKEQCHTWDIGRSEVHITADVVYAVDQYLCVTGDKSLNRDTAQLFIETARYWASRFTYDARKDVYNLLFVKGPDEYCGVSSNNVYTVMLARYNLNLALEAVQNGYGEDISPAETAKWRDIIEKSHIGYDADRDLFLQDDDFSRLEPFNFDMKQGDTPVYRKFDYDRLQRYKVLKQADLVLLMLLLPDDFTPEQKRAIWDCYEPITLHDSSLSYGIHAWAATVLGHWGKAGQYFHKSLLLDLENVMGNTGAEGVHMAALGATWQAIVFGFAGLSVDQNGKPALSPRLPPDWKSLRFSFYANGARFVAEITPDSHSIHPERRSET